MPNCLLERKKCAHTGPSSRKCPSKFVADLQHNSIRTNPLENAGAATVALVVKAVEEMVEGTVVAKVTATVVAKAEATVVAKAGVPEVVPEMAAAKAQ